MTDTGLEIGDVSVAIVESVKLLGVILDSTLSMDKQVNALVKACNFHIRVLRHVGSCLMPGAARTILIGLVTSRLDYCNSLLYGTSESNLDKLPRVQNNLARVVLRASWGCHTAPLLRDLHWLSIQFRIRYKDDLQGTPLKGTRLSSFHTARLHSYSRVEIQRSTSSGQTETIRRQGLESFQKLDSGGLEQHIRNTCCATSPGSFRKLLKTELFASAFIGS